MCVTKAKQGAKCMDWNTVIRIATNIGNNLLMANGVVVSLFYEAEIRGNDSELAVRDAGAIVTSASRQGRPRKGSIQTCQRAYHVS